MKKIIVIVVFVCFVFVACKKKEAPVPVGDARGAIAVKPGEREVAPVALLPSSMIERDVELKDDCKDFSKKLGSCTQAVCKMEMGFMGTQEHSIKGVENRRCVYTQSMGGKEIMRCRVDRKQGELLGSYLDALFNSGGDISVSAGGGLAGNSFESKEVLGGKEVVNPFNGFLQNKVCVVPGYEERVELAPGVKIINK